MQDKKYYAITVVVSKYNEEENMFRVKIDLEFIKASSQEEAVGIGHKLAEKAYPKHEGFKDYLVVAKLCPNQKG